MNAIQLIKDGHDRVRSLFEQYESTAHKADLTREDIYEKVSRELHVQSRIEEEFLYPAVMGKTGARDMQNINESVEEYRLADALMEDMQNLDPADEKFHAKFTVLMENIRHHMEEEEQELLPKAESLFNDQELEELGNRMSERRSELVERSESGFA